MISSHEMLVYEEVLYTFNHQSFPIMNFMMILVRIHTWCRVTVHNKSWDNTFIDGSNHPLRMVMEPTYFAFRRSLDTPIILRRSVIGLLGYIYILYCGMDVYAYRFHDICPFSKTFESLQSRSYIWDANHHQGALFFFRIAKSPSKCLFPTGGGPSQDESTKLSHRN